MNRRSFLVGTGVVVSTAGCVSVGGGDSGEGDGNGLGEGGPGGPTETPPPLSGGDDAFGDDFATSSAWSAHCFDAARTGYNPDTDPPRGEVGAAWFRTPVRGRRTFQTTAPVTDDSRVYVGSGAGADDADDQRGGFLAAFEGETGERRWLQTISRGGVRGVAHADGLVLAVTSNHDAGSAAIVASVPDRVRDSTATHGDG